MDKIPDGYDLEEAVRALVPEHIRAKEIEPGNARMVQLKESIKKPLIAIKKVGWEHSSIETSQREGILELIWLYWNTEEVDIKFKYIFPFLFEYIKLTSYLGALQSAPKLFSSS